VVPLIVFILVKMKKKRNTIYINDNDVDESMGINNDVLIP
jgi:hypothetical protein